MPGTDGAAVEQSADFLRTRNRLLASLLVLGGLGALAVAATSQDPDARGPVPIGIAVAACTLGAVLFTRRHRFPTAAVLPLVLLLQLSSTVLAWSAGSFEVATGTLGYSYLWTCAFVAYFLPWRHAVLNLVVTLSLYAGWLSMSTPAAVARPRWIAVAGVLIALTLVIGRLRDEVQRLIGALGREARHDSLTGLLNRRGFLAAGQVELARAVRSAQPLSVLAVDVDHFKTLNDGFGHAAGDAALAALGELLLGLARGHDVVARIGGEEFAVLLPGTDLKAALHVAHRLRHAVQDLPTARRLTVSIGVDVRPAGADGSSLDELLLGADRALYRAKEKGRNRVEVHGAAPIDLTDPKPPVPVDAFRLP
jgi:diguanylate cyclase (GGDEF)-like protein